MRQGSAVAETVARLGRAIGMGLLRPGDRLPAETRLADDLGISPVTLRSALGILRGAGLVETQRGAGGGTFGRAASAEALRLDGDARPTEAELRDLVDYAPWSRAVRPRSPPSAATPEQLADLDDSRPQMEALEAFEPWSARDTLFHLVVADASGSPGLVREVAGLRTEVYRISRLLPVPAGVRTTRQPRAPRAA